jgi:flagellar assembly protein FliH
MGNCFWQVKKAESHLSNLLKKTLEPEIAAFGFPVIDPVIQMANVGNDSVKTEVTDQEEQLPEPAENPEELYRRKLLELERRTQVIERDAYSQGFAQGEKDGFDYGQKSVQVLKSQLERIAQNMEALPAKILQDYRDWLIRTSIRIARQIVDREIRTSPEIVADSVNDLLEAALEHSTLTVYLNPHDLEIVEKRTDLTRKANGKHCTVKADRDLERGACRIESAVQLLDASITSLFENLEKRMMEEG